MAEAEQFSLRWNNFHNNLSEGFHSLLEEVDLVDVTLAAEGQYLQAHKIVLSVCSPYFKQLFKANPCKHPIVILKDVCHKDLVALLQFMYQGEVNVCQEELAPFLKTAEMLQIKGLTGNDTKPSPQSVSPSVSSVQSSSPSPRITRESQETTNSGETISRPFKRLRTESPHVGTAPLSSSSSQVSAPMSSSTAHTAPATSQASNPSEQSKEDFVSLTSPKLEPVEYDSEPEGRKDPPPNLAQLLQGSDSSQPPSDLSQAPVLFNPVAVLPQDSGGSQDSMQGLVLSERKVMQVGQHELHLTSLRGRNNSRLRRRCVPCYDMNRRYLGNHAANLRTAKVSTFCATCYNVPFMCVTCFKIHVTSTV